MAIIQLKKVLSYNPKYVKAHQLLALLYINIEEWEKAHKELIKCSQIDTNNTTTLRYLKEVEHMLMPEEGDKSSPKKKLFSDDVIRYQSGNETIIQPINVNERKGVTSLLNLGIGLVIGIAIAWFLILPAQIQNAKADINSELRVVSEQSDAKTATIDELNQKVQSLSDANITLKEELQSYQGTDGALKATDGLMMAVSTYLANPEDIETIAVYMESLEAEEGDDVTRTASFDTLESSFLTLVSPQLATYYYDIGYTSYRSDDYEGAIPNLERVYRYDNTNGDALFYLGNCYRRTGDNDKAKEIYAQVIDAFPGTEKARNSETYLAEINNEN